MCVLDYTGLPGHILTPYFFNVSPIPAGLETLDKTIRDIILGRQTRDLISGARKVVALHCHFNMKVTFGR